GPGPAGLGGVWPDKPRAVAADGSRATGRTRTAGGSSATGCAHTAGYGQSREPSAGPTGPGHVIGTENESIRSATVMRGAGNIVTIGTFRLSAGGETRDPHARRLAVTIRTNLTAIRVCAPAGETSVA